MGRVVCELPEMAGVGNRREISRLKAWITRQDDGAVRMAYARHPQDTPRRFVAVGTANGECLPNDETGNRRWVVIETRDTRAKTKPESYMNMYRDQLFAEAMDAFDDDSEANLPRDLAGVQSESNERYRKADTALEELVAEYLNGRLSAHLVDGVQPRQRNHPGAPRRGRQGNAAAPLAGSPNQGRPALEPAKRVTGDGG